jgi:ABC-type antimicrobial peptide transport system permease subunit
MVMRNLLSVDNFSIALDPVTSVILVIASVVITIISGLWPAHHAAKQDPVVALRSE